MHLEAKQHVANQQILKRGEEEFLSMALLTPPPWTSSLQKRESKFMLF